MLSDADLPQFRKLATLMRRHAICEACSKIISIWDNQTHGHCRHCGANWRLLVSHAPPRTDGRGETTIPCKRLTP